MMKIIKILTIILLIAALIIGSFLFLLIGIYKRVKIVLPPSSRRQATVHRTVAIDCSNLSTEK